MSRCEICKCWLHESIFGQPHKCPPLWLCRFPEDGDGDEEGFDYKVYARDSQEAAEKLAERCESDNDYAFVDNGGVDIDVKNSMTEETVSFFVNAEPTVSYWAVEK